MLYLCTNKNNTMSSKILINLILTIMFLGALYLTSILFDSGFYKSDTFSPILKGVISLVMLIAYGLIIYLYYNVNKSKDLFLLLLGTFLISSCTRVKPNESYIYTKDCGDEWHQLKQGEALPTNKVSNCFYSLSLPKTSLSGDASFLANFKSGLVTITFNYGYIINDELKYIKKAKFRFNTTEDGSSEDEQLNAKIEAAENRLIDLTLKEITKEYVINVNITNYNHSDLENILTDLFNKAFEDRGIYLEDLAMTIQMAPETEYAVDVINALNIYKANGEEDLGRDIISSRAGASKIEVRNDSKTENVIPD